MRIKYKIKGWGLFVPTLAVENCETVNCDV